MSDIYYKDEALRYWRLKVRGEAGTQQAFCEQLQQETGYAVSFPYFKKVLRKLRAEGALDKIETETPKPEPAPTKEKEKKVVKKKPAKRKKRLDWHRIKREYMSWKYATLSEIASFVGVHPSDREFRAATAGWRAQREKLPPPDLPTSLDEIARSRAAQRARDIYAEALSAHYKLLDIVKDSAENALDRWKEPDKSPWHTQMAAQATMDLSKALEKILPAIKGLENLRAVHMIFDDLGEGKIDIVQAALDFARLGVLLPKPIEIMLTKHKPEEAKIEDGELITDEAIMARRAQLLEEIHTERIEFVRERKKMVSELKAETSDSFKAQMIDNGKA